MHMFVLSISVAPLVVARIKVELARSVTQVKSSHRVEALGRGLGFCTYAALLAASRSAKPPIAAVTGAVFSAYLKKHDFKVDPAHLYRAVAHAAIQVALDAEPRLHIHGIGLGRPQRNSDGSRQTPQQRHADFIERREECRGQLAAEAFLR
jgi:hypothetical protein